MNLSSGINPRYILDISGMFDKSGIYTGYIWDISGIYPGCIHIPDESGIYLKYILECIPIYPGCILRLIWDSKAGGWGMGKVRVFELAEIFSTGILDYIFDDSREKNFPGGPVWAHTGPYGRSKKSRLVAVSLFDRVLSRSHQYSKISSTGSRNSKVSHFLCTPWYWGFL
jgi:hypothetical protein